MLKTALIHFGSGIVAAVIILLTTMLPESIHLAVYLPLSILTALFYIWAGVFLKNEPFHKVALLSQALMYIGHMAPAIIKTTGKFIISLAGGSVIWNVTLGRLVSYSNFANCLAYIFMVFAAPAFIALGMKIAGKRFEINLKKEILAATYISILFFLINSIYPISYSFIKKTGEPIETVKAGIALLIILLLSFAGGFVLRKISWSKICFIMINLSLIGITFCFFFNSFFLHVFCGAEMMFDLFFKIAFNVDPILMFFIPPLFVLLGSFIGRKLIKKKTKKSDYSKK